LTIDDSRSTIYYVVMRSAKLTVIFYIILCLEVGGALTFFPWIHVIPYLPTFGLGDWGENYFLLYAAKTTGLMGLRPIIASGWVRGAVTGLGLLNLGIAFWEIAHFRQTVRALSGLPAEQPTPSTKDAAQPSATDHLSDYERRDDPRDPSAQ
jgi:hypothetical protein